MRSISKEICWAEYEYIHPPPTPPTITPLTCAFDHCIESLTCMSNAINFTPQPAAVRLRGY